MTQIASLVAVVAVFIGLWTLIPTFYSQGGGGGLIHETKLPMQELELNMQEGLFVMGGGGGRVIVGFYGSTVSSRK